MAGLLGGKGCAMVSGMMPTSHTSGAPLLDTQREVSIEFDLSALSRESVSALLGAPRCVLWFVATCHRCDANGPVPFATEAERDTWAIEHATETGHVVHLMAEVDGMEIGEHTSAMLRRGDVIGGQFLCTAPGCERWSDLFVSLQLAVASFRSHRKGSTQ
jgi:hypothetical protein